MAAIATVLEEMSGRSTDTSTASVATPGLMCSRFVGVRQKSAIIMISLVSAAILPEISVRSRRAKRKLRLRSFGLAFSMHRQPGDRM